jgi:hypothetical protein
MAAAHKLQLRKLCNQDETYELAQKLLPIAKAKTGPGSGHELGDRAVCLPAVCAYLASQRYYIATVLSSSGLPDKILRRLGNGDVKKNAAASSACANPKVFTVAIDIIRSALNEAEIPEDGRSSPIKVTYDSLIKRYKLGRPKTLLGWMENVETKFAKSHKRYEAGKPEFICGVFFWVCKKAKVSHPCTVMTIPTE